MLKSERKKRKLRIRVKIFGTAKRPRLSVFRSNKFIYAQLVDDAQGHTLAACRGSNARQVGEKIATVALAQKIKTAVFDRSGYQYHGKVKALAEAAREKGLKL